MERDDILSPGENPVNATENIEIVRIVPFPGWQSTSAGEREVCKALRKALFNYRLHQDAELFDKAYGYVKQYY